MPAALIAPLAGIGIGLALNALMGKDKNAEAAQQNDQKQLLTMGQKAAEVGDHEWMAANTESMQNAGISPAVIQALATHTENQNRRLNLAGDTSIPLSPNNTAMMRSQQASNPTDAIAALDAHMATINPNDRVGPVYNSLLDQRGKMIARESAGIPGPEGAEAAKIGDLNKSMRGELDAVDAQNAPPSTAPQPAPIQPNLTVPAARQPRNTSKNLQTSVGTISSSESIPGTTGKEVLSSLISQAQQKNLHPNEVMHTFNQENVRRLQAGEPALDFDEGAMKSFREQNWEQLRAGIQHNLVSQGMDPQQAFAQSAQLAMAQDPNVPERWMSVLKPDPGQMVAATYQKASGDISRMIGSRLAAVGTVPAKGGKGATPNFNINEPFIAQAVNSYSLPPEAANALTQHMAQQAHSSFLQAVQQTRPELDPMQQNYLAMQMAFNAAGGNVPPQWRAFIEKDMKQLFGLSDADMAAYSALSPFYKPDPMNPDFRNRISAARVQMEMDKDVRGALLSKIQTPEGVTAVGDAYSKPTSTGGLSTEGAKKVAPIGQMERNIVLEQKGKEKTQTEEVQKQFRIAPPETMKEVQGRDSLYRTGFKIQQLAMTPDKTGKTLVDRYGSYPGTITDLIRNASGALGKTDPQLREYTDLIGELMNQKRVQLAGTAASKGEMKQLLSFIPDPTDNVRTALGKVNDFMKQGRATLQRDIETIGANYPGTDTSKLHFTKIEKLYEDARKKKEEAKK